MKVPFPIATIALVALAQLSGNSAFSVAFAFVGFVLDLTRFLVQRRFVEKRP